MLSVKNTMIDHGGDSAIVVDNDDNDDGDDDDEDEDEDDDNDDDEDEEEQTAGDSCEQCISPSGRYKQKLKV